MCLSIPAKVLEINGDMARASIGGTIIEAGLHMLDNVKVGDYILIHTGFALQKISDDEAQETLKIIQEYEDFNKMLDEEGNLNGL